MYRGTSQPITLTLDTTLNLKQEVKELWVTFKSELVQKDFYFSKNEVEIKEDNSLVVQFTQEDTLDFNVGKVEVQVRFVLRNGRSYATNSKQIEVKKILKDGVIQ